MRGRGAVGARVAPTRPVPGFRVLSPTPGSGVFSPPLHLAGRSPAGVGGIFTPTTSGWPLTRRAPPVPHSDTPLIRGLVIMLPLFLSRGYHRNRWKGFW